MHGMRVDIKTPPQRGKQFGHLPQTFDGERRTGERHHRRFGLGGPADADSTLRAIAAASWVQQVSTDPVDCLVLFQHAWTDTKAGASLSVDATEHAPID